MASDARIWGSRNKVPVGVGFIAGPLHVVTCAHVVADALGDRNLAKGDVDPKWTIEVDFPAVADKDTRHVLVAKVHAWARLDGPAPDDVAILKLSEPIPDATTPVVVSNHYTPGQRVRGYGVRSGLPAGAYVEGTYEGPLDKYRLQITSENEDTALAAGCSGGAFWLSDGGGVIGMATAAILRQSGILLRIEDLARFFELKTGIELGTQQVKVSTAGLINAALEGSLDEVALIKVAQTFPMGPAISGFFVKSEIKRAYAQRLNSKVSSDEVIRQANGILLASLKKRPPRLHTFILTEAQLPNPDRGWLFYWSEVFALAGVLSPRMVAALLLAAPVPLLGDIVAEATALLDELR
jgi:Trypsin-like peptidase domain